MKAIVEAAICVFTKPPLAGKVKTRLVPAVGAERAAELAEAFLRDTLTVLDSLAWAKPVIAVTAPFTKEYLRSYPMWVQPEGGLEVRLETILRRALLDHPVAFAIGADSPGLPPSCLEQARDHLVSHDAVLGPCRDGGFYLIGVKHSPPGLLSGIEWSQPTTMQSTVARLQQQGLSVALIPEWFDVDTAAELSWLESLLEQRTIDCCYTRAALESIRRSMHASGPVTK
ncbi:MAG TPA: TIGR04282 family arsenosugar biosynthesis glycosyltransferase [Candidatus Saccharimonadales bacterium]|nr:TIGR04282 family arsenosugar biosynthesis glycosyltransferase [Candidatus Saccharimonadales bacterium]